MPPLSGISVKATGVSRFFPGLHSQVLKGPTQVVSRKSRRVKVLGREGLGPRKADGVGRSLSWVLLGPGQFCGSWLLMAWGADGWLPFYSVRGNLWIPVMATGGFTLWQLLPRIWCICASVGSSSACQSAASSCLEKPIQKACG